MGAIADMQPFDFIIVGGEFPITWSLCLWKVSNSKIGGTAGNAVAGRLAENPKVRVLVIEAGIRWADIRVSVPL